MRTMYLLYLSFSILLANEASAQSWPTVSRKIMAQQKHLLEKGEENRVALFQMKYYNKCRQSIDVCDIMEVDSKCDTLFLLESHVDALPASAHSLIWNSRRTLFYDSSDNGNMTISLYNGIAPIYHTLFTNHLLSLASKWEIEKIKKENDYLLPALMMYLTRVIWDDGIVQIDCISFREFYNLQRDGNDGLGLYPYKQYLLKLPRNY